MKILLQETHNESLFEDFDEVHLSYSKMYMRKLAKMQLLQCAVIDQLILCKQQKSNQENRSTPSDRLQMP